MPDDVIQVDDPRVQDVLALLRRHLEFAHATTPPEHVHALGPGGLLDPSVTCYGFRRSGRLLAVGALRHLGGQHAELKSMHTAAEERGKGIGRAMLDHLIGVARARGLRRLSLETGAMAAFAPARVLYASAGFTVCGPFADYPPSPTSTFMTLVLDTPVPAAPPPAPAPAPPAPGGTGPHAPAQDARPGPPG